MKTVRFRKRFGKDFMDSPRSTCSVCQREFEVRFRYQLREQEGRFEYFCSQRCQSKGLEVDEQHACEACGSGFVLEYPYQVVAGDGEPRYFCSPTCREQAPQSRRDAIREASQSARPMRRIAVFNHKGGTGKTTTSVNIAAGLAERGVRVLLVDADGQGNVGASLGISGEKNLYHVLVHGLPAEEAVVPVRPGLDVLTSNESLAAAELHLASLPNRARVLRERLSSRITGYDVVVIDCAPALSLMNQNALVYADSLLVPVACDYLSLVGVRQVLRTVKNVRELLHHDVQLAGVVPTFFDIRNRISRDALQTLREHFGDRCFPPVRVNTRLREAPSAKQTIFEYAPESHGAADYRTVVDMLDVAGLGRSQASPPEALPPLRAAS